MNSNSSHILIVGHRGAYRFPPENSLKSFREAINLNAEYTEFDIHQSKDGEIVIMHDENTFRTTGFNGLIKNMTLKELKELDCGDGEKIPTLHELIKIAKGKIGLFCEIKAKGLEEKLVEILTEENLLEFELMQATYPDQSEFEMLFSIIEKVPALHEVLIKNVNDLAEELLYDVDKLDKVIEKHTKTKTK